MTTASWGGAARLYTDVFRPFEEAGQVLGATGLGTDEGVEITVAGLRLQLVDVADEPGAAPVTPATNIMVNVDSVFFGWSATVGQDDQSAAVSRARAALDTIWDGLVDDGGEVLMPLDSYPFSEQYSWVVDRYGVSWQLMLTDPAGDPRPALLPSFMFCGAAQNRAAEAVYSWVSAFSEVFGPELVDGVNSVDGTGEATATGARVRYDQLAGPVDAVGPVDADSVLFSDARLGGVWVTAMDSAVEQQFTFTDAVAFRVACDTPVQAEVLRRRLGLDTGGRDRFGIRSIPELQVAQSAQSAQWQR